MKKYICALKNGYILLPQNLHLSGNEMIATKGLNGEIKLFSDDAWEKVCKCLHSIDDELTKNVVLRKILTFSDVVEVRNGRIKLNSCLREILPEGNINMYLEKGIITFTVLEKKNDFFDLCVNGENKNDTQNETI